MAQIYGGHDMRDSRKARGVSACEMWALAGGEVLGRGPEAAPMVIWAARGGAVALGDLGPEEGDEVFAGGHGEDARLPQHVHQQRRRYAHQRHERHHIPAPPQHSAFPRFHACVHHAHVSKAVAFV